MTGIIPDTFWPWPAEYEVPGGFARACQEISKVLEKGALAQFLQGPQSNLAEYIALQGREWGVNPWWAIISAQREQSAIEYKILPAAALNAVMGYVGLDAGRVALPGYYGVFNQVYRSISQVSWYLNLRPDPRQGKSTERWRPGIEIEVQAVKGGPWVKYKPPTRTEFAQLQYTPHLDPDVRRRNYELVDKYCPRFLS